MAHLGAEVAAYVDGQLSGDAAAAGEEHLADCDDCASTVRYQRLIKSRMGSVTAPVPSSDLVAALANLSDDDRHAGFSERVRGATVLPVGLVVVGAAVAVVALAYLIGGGGPGDEVRPDFEAYTAEFFGATSVTSVSTSRMSDAGVERLQDQGWPCQDELDDLGRTTTGFDRASGVVAVTYTNGVARLELYEQTGRLDQERLDDFVKRTFGRTTVWTRGSDPMVLTWDRDGVVYTVVTDAHPLQVARAVAELPAPTDRTNVQRIGDGLARMSALGPAA